MPLPCRKSLRRDVPEPFGATRITSTSAGGTIPVLVVVCDAEAVGEIEGLARREVFLHGGHAEIWPASERRNSIIVPLSHASSISNNVSPGTQPSSTALSQLPVPFLCPTITLNPLSLRFRDWPGPWDSVAEHGYGLVLQHFPRLFKREFGACHNIFLHSAKIHLCHNSSLVLMIYLVIYLLSLLESSSLTFSKGDAVTATRPERTNCLTQPILSSSAYRESMASVAPANSTRDTPESPPRYGCCSRAGACSCPRSSGTRRWIS